MRGRVVLSEKSFRYNSHAASKRTAQGKKKKEEVEGANLRRNLRSRQVEGLGEDEGGVRTLRLESSGACWSTTESVQVGGVGRGFWEGKKNKVQANSGREKNGGNQVEVHLEV